MRHSVQQALRPKRGQVLALGAVSMLVLALMLMLSFNLSQTLHEKIRLQQHSDAMAYSMATIEARAMNYIAYSNRAIAAAYVAMTSIHAYMAAMSVTSAMLQAGMINFFQVAGLEAAQCNPYTPQHCFDAIQAVMIAFRFGQKSREYGDGVKDREGDFNDAIDAFDQMADRIHESQLMVVQHTMNVLMGNDLGALKSTNAPQASQLSPAVGGMNVMQFGCALEAVPGLDCPDRPKLDKRHRSQIMAEVANATRPGWPARRTGIPFPIHLDPQFLQELMQDIQGNEGITMPLMHQGTAKVIEGTSRGDLESTSQGSEGITIGAEEHGFLATYWRHGLGAFMYSAEIYSNANGGDHRPNAAHEDDHDRFEGIQSEDTCLASGNCFINFRADSSRPDFGQPKVYAYFTQDLRLRKDGRRGPWEINQSGRITFDHGEQGRGTLTLVPMSEGRAVSKAMVYYHRLGDWTEHPNLFNPFWRAKLHPFTHEEVQEVLSAAGDSEGTALSREAAVEGREP